MSIPVVPYANELEQPLEEFLKLVERVPLRPETILENRAIFEALVPPIEQVASGHAVDYHDLTIPGPANAPDVTVTVVRPTGDPPSNMPGVLHIHGGGYVLGNRFFGIDDLIAMVEQRNVVGVSVEYRLAPEHLAPASAEDCYAALQWMDTQAPALRIDRNRILVSGFSAGGGLSAAVALMARDRRGPKLVGQYLGAPMIDDRDSTVSTRQYHGIGAWDRDNNITGWDAILGSHRGNADVSLYAAPARAQDLSDLPSAFIEVGAAEVFRDEAVQYATRMWQAGTQAELHVWAGGFHGFPGFAPGTNVANAAIAARQSWLDRVL